MMPPCTVTTSFPTPAVQLNSVVRGLPTGQGDGAGSPETNGLAVDQGYGPLASAPSVPLTTTVSAVASPPPAWAARSASTFSTSVPAGR